MASYVHSVLIPDEEVIYQAHISLWSMLGLLIAGVFFIFSFFPVGLLLLAIAAIRYMTTELAITNKRVIAKFGFISRRTVEINLQRIESIQIDQGVIGRIFNYGTLVISGAGNPQAPIPGISDPLLFRRMFTESQDRLS